MKNIINRLKNYKAKPTFLEKTGSNILTFYKQFLLPSTATGFIGLGSFVYLTEEDCTKYEVLEMATIGALAFGSLVIITPFSPIGLLLFME